MTNNVLNFSWITKEPLRLHLDLKTATAPASLTAAEAAQFAHDKHLDVLVITEDNSPVGLFFPDYLVEILGTSGRVPVEVRERHLKEPLSALIQKIDRAFIDFHSEIVNVVPNIRKCPKGHVTSGNPCPRHHEPTTAY